MTTAIGMVTLLSYALGGREMSGKSTSSITRTCTVHPLAYMYRLFRGTVLGLEVQCLKVLGLRLRGHTVVVPGEVLVMVNMTMNLVVVALSPIALADHVFPIVVITIPLVDHVFLFVVIALLFGLG